LDLLAQTHGRAYHCSPSLQKRRATIDPPKGGRGTSASNEKGVSKGAVRKWRTAPARIGQWVVGVVKNRFGLETPLKTDDRHILEQVIIPYFVRPEFSRILFVGCDYYTSHYNRLFAGKEYWTLEKDPARSKYGASRHVTDVLKNVSRHFAPGYFDVILCNGVLGWGLFDREEIEESFEGCFVCLREGGVLLLGWNDTSEKLPFPLEESRSLGRFRPFPFPPLGTPRHLTQNPNRHTFSFFVKGSTLG
jgi:hypothetical protein